MEKIIREHHEQCPKCGNMTLPMIDVGSKANASACQSCGAIVERKDKEKKDGDS